MMKITAIVSLVLIVTWSQAVSKTKKYKKDDEPTNYNSQYSSEGGVLWVSGLSCDSCGAECQSACGTRHFRACCFNYLRRKRGSTPNDLIKIMSNKPYENMKTGKKTQLTNMENGIDSPFWSVIYGTKDLDQYFPEDTQDKYQMIYDA